jgi:hypothetical protein
MSDEDIILIWSLQGKQVFRSAHALKYWSYPFEQLTSLPYYELFERAPEIEKAYETYFADMVQGRILETMVVAIPTHIVTEKRSKKRWRSRITPNLISPLKDSSGRVAAFIHTCRAEHLPNDPPPSP